MPMVYETFAVCTAIFGVCHCLGWNAPFPTKVERVMWGIAIVCCMGIPLLAIGLLHLVSIGQSVVGDAFLTAFFGIYVIARIFLLFESLFALRSVTPDLYATVPWSQYIPHF